ncbi:hypothetical protein INT44_008471 [Umbelopsis vinacea]|uniref:Uncharacterized protein n=1 Tax=Umbelopsis vinacea TaxID=44442 RepID=A0A8H7UDI1_9FUNG|nr:hypothetical protein INT44_008471 [Umbelopsis vinacea]
MSIVNACLIILRKGQYLAQCTTDGRISGFASRNGKSEQNVADDCEHYFITIAIVSIVLSLFFNIMNASVSVLAYIFKLAQYMFKSRRIQEEEWSHFNLEERRPSRRTEPSANPNRASGSGSLAARSFSRSRVSPAMKDTNVVLPGDNETIASSNAPENPVHPIAIPLNPQQQPSPSDIPIDQQ